LLKDVELVFACDVKNPLLGENGAARVYAPQKGATLEEEELLEQGLAHLSKVVREISGVDISGMEMAGAAGGIGGVFCALFGAKLLPGAELVMDLVSWESKLHGADVVITGEGRLDAQSTWGKTVYAVYKRAIRKNKPVVALVGEVVDVGDMDIAVFSVAQGPVSLEVACKNTGLFLRQCAKELGKLMSALEGGRRLL